MLAAALLLAQTTETKPAPPGMDLFMLFGVPLLLFVFLILLPMRRDSKVRRELLSTLKKGDRVLVNGFLIGTVIQITSPDKPQAEGEVVVRGEENTRFRVLRGSITRILKSDDSKDAKEGS